jgi:hypothetical protein
MRVRVFIVGALVLLLAACGSSGNSGSGGSSSSLSPSAYRAQIAKIKKQATNARGDEALALQAQSIPQLGQRLDAFAFTTNHIGDEVAKLNPPRNAEVANAELAKGMHDISRATHQASVEVAKLRTAQAGVAYLEKSSASARGARELDDAIARLKKLGYTSG